MICAEAEVLNARMYLRGKLTYRLLKQMPLSIGCRLEKTSFLVSSTKAGGTDVLMTMV
jgi:hypothetical protein